MSELISDKNNSLKGNSKTDEGAPHENENVKKAHEQAETDIAQDPDLSNEPGPGDDLDEGELARLDGEE